MKVGYMHLIEPIRKIGQESFHGVIDTYIGAEVEIGNYTSIAPPLYVHGATEHPWVFNQSFVSTFPFGDKWEIDYPKTSSKGKIVIGSDVWIGESVTLLSGVNIGDGVIIGARSVVARDIPPFAIAVGNPARIVRYRFTPESIQKLLKIRWWNWDKKRIETNIEYMKNIQRFIKNFS